MAAVVRQSEGELNIRADRQRVIAVEDLESLGLVSIHRGRKWQKNWVAICVEFPAKRHA